MATLTSQLIISLIDRVSAPARAAAGALGGITRTIGEANRLPVAFSDRLDGALASNRRSLDSARAGVVDAVGSFYALREAIGGPVMAAAEFESAMADVRKVVDFPTPEAFDAFRSDLMALSREIPTAVNGLAEIAAAAGQAGIAGDDLIRFTEAASKIGVAFDIGADQAGGSMANLMTALGLTIDETVLLADAMNHLSNNQASSAAEILDVVQRVGAQATMFGFTAEQTAAFASAMVAAGAQSDVAATSFRNMGAALTKGEAATKSQRTAFSALGLEATEVARRMQEDAVGTTTDVLRRIAQLPAEQQAAISSQIFGSEARALGPLLTNLDLVDETLGMIADRSQYAGSAFKEFMARNDTFLANMQRFKNVLTALAIAVGDALLPAISGLADALTPMITRLTELVAAYPQVTTAVVGAAAAFVAFGGAMAGLRFAGLLGANGALSLIAGGLRGISLVARAGPLLAVGAALSFLRQNWDGITLGVQSFRDAFAAGMGEAGPVIQSVSDAARDLFGWFEAITGPIDPALWQGWGAAAGSAAADVVSALSRAAAGAVEFGRELVLDPAAAALRAVQGGRAIAQGVLDGLSDGWTLVSSWIGGLDLNLSSLANSAGASLGSLGADVANAAIAALSSGWASITSYAGELDWASVGADVVSGVLSVWSGVGELAIASISGYWTTVSTFVSGLDIDWSQVAANIILGVPAIAYGLGSALVQAMAGAYSAVHDWASTVSIDWGAVGQSIGSGVGRLVGAVGGFLYETFTEIWSGVASWLASDGPGVDWGGAASALVGAIFDGIGAAWGAYSDFTLGLLRGLFGEIPDEVFEAGVNLIQSLKDGAVQQLEDFLSWVSGIPGQIIAAIGRIDLSSMIDWPSPPAWWNRLTGAGDEPEAPDVDGQRAKGGPISRGGSYLVGEEGPELITATRNGYVHPSGEGPMAPPAGAASAPPSITVAVGDIVVSPTIHTTERVDPAQLSQEVGQQMREQVREVFRGVFADTGMRMA
ncbi:MAG: phage tail tape measure protein [Pelagibaca sp.]